jgi:hypothetical protein
MPAFLAALADVEAEHHRARGGGRCGRGEHAGDDVSPRSRPATTCTPSRRPRRRALADDLQGVEALAVTGRRSSSARSSSSPLGGAAGAWG